MKKCLIIFADGDTGNSLKRFFSENTSNLIKKAFIEDTVLMASKVGCGIKIIAHGSAGDLPFLKEIAPKFRFYREEGENFSRKLYNALYFAHKSGAEETAVIRGNAPNLPFEYVDDAFGKLLAHDLVLGPTRSGGCYLIGLKRPDFELFRRLKWHDREVFHDIKIYAHRLRLKTVFLKKWYNTDDSNWKELLKRDLLHGKIGNSAPNTKKIITGL